MMPRVVPPSAPVVMPTQQSQAQREEMQGTGRAAPPSPPCPADDAPAEAHRSDDWSLLQSLSLSPSPVASTRPSRSVSFSGEPAGAPVPAQPGAAVDADTDAGSHVVHAALRAARRVGGQLLAALLWLPRIVLAYLVGGLVVLYQTTGLLGDAAWAAATPLNEISASSPVATVGSLRTAVLRSPTVSEAILSAIPSDMHLRRERRRVARARMLLARRYFNAMAARINEPLLRITMYWMRKIWRILYPFGLRWEPDEVERVRRLGQSGLPLVYLPTHKSHVDYMLMSYLCFSTQLPFPRISVGDSWSVPVLGWLLRHMGGFHIRRGAEDERDRDPLYAAVYHAYIEQLLATGHALEFFIEGARSRTGKVLPPRPRLLQCIVDAVLGGRVHDALLVPISIGYDRIVENDAHVDEQSGGHTRRERTLPIMRRIVELLWRDVTQDCFGCAEVHFGETISIREYLMARCALRNSAFPVAATARHAGPSAEATPNAHGRETDGATTDERRARLGSPPMLTASQCAYALGYRALYEANRAAVVTPAALVATTLLTHFQRGISAEQLMEEVTWLRDQVVARGGRVTTITLDTVDVVVTSVLECMASSKSQLVKRHKDRFVVSTYSPRERMELSLYRNQLLHHFVSEGVVACAIYAYETQHGRTDATAVPLDELMRTSNFLSRLLRYEFIYKPNPLQSDRFSDTVTFMVRRGILKFVDDSASALMVRDELTNDEPRGAVEYLFLCSLFWHFIDSYWLACCGLLLLLPDRVVREATLVAAWQEAGEQLYFDGYLDLYEAVAKETLSNALTLLASWRVVEFICIEDSRSDDSIGMDAAAAAAAATAPQPDLGGSSSDVTVVSAPTGCADGQRIVRLAQEFRKEASIAELAHQIGRLRKRLRAQRSRRFLSKCPVPSSTAGAPPAPEEEAFVAARRRLLVVPQEERVQHVRAATALGVA